ncbi:MAG: VWA domain-containing protein [Clostridiaceae bacterium]|nr:VWA domain-containing protein [Clostridiaceae bacterium]
MKIVQIMALLLAFLIQFINISVVKAENLTTSNLDVVFLMDASGSMKSSDAEELRVEAIKMFLDMSINQGNKFGLVAYSDNIVREHSLDVVKLQKDKDNIKNMAEGIPFGEKTDTGLGLKEAVKLMEAGHEQGNRAVIILLSDGKNDPKRSSEESIKDLNEAINTAKSKGYTIYTIGINHDGTVDKSQLSSISSSTGGKNYITNASEELPKILTEIYADNTKVKVEDGGTITANGGFQEVKVNIPNSNVIEANVSIMSSNPIEVKLMDPTLKEIIMPSSNAYVTFSKTYSMLKILKPAEGDWTLKVKGISGDKIKISYVYNYDLAVNATFIPSTIKKGENVTVDAYLSSNGKKTTDKTVYHGIAAKLIIHNLADNSIKEHALTNKGDGFTGKLSMDSSGSFEASVKIDGKGFSRESIPVKLTVDDKVLVNRTPIKEKSSSKSILIFIGIGSLLLLALVIIIIKALKKSHKKGFGRVMLEVKDEATQEYLSPQYKILENYSVRFSLYDVLGLKEEYAETQDLYFKFGEDCLIVDNKSLCTIQKSGRNIEKGESAQLVSHDRVVIILNKVLKSVALEFYAE